jgi:hypothetical protein
VNGAYRWEWRAFAPSPASFGVLSRSQSDVDTVTQERYVLSIASPDNVKTRDESLDIRTLVAVDATGLEQWRPALKAQFPIDDVALDAAWSAWRLPPPLLGRRRCTLEEFLTDIVEPEPALCLVSLETRRRRLVVEGCPGEHVTLTVGHQVLESVAFEHLDPAEVWRAVRALGLEKIENTNYPAALKRIVGFAAAEKPEQMEKS